MAFFSIFSFFASLPNARVWDDDTILGTRLAPGSVSSPFQLWREPYGGGEHRDGFRPLSLTLLYAEHQVFGGSMWGFRLVSLVLHSFTGLALLRVLGWIAPPRIAWFAAILFSIHPVHAEAVAMAYGQLELLAALFALLAIDQYILSERHLAHLGASLVFSFLSVCSKESGLMLPAVLIILRGFYLNAGNSWRTRWLTWREAMFALPGMVYLALRYDALGTLLAPPESTLTYGYPVVLRVKTIIVSFGSAIRLSIFPTGQTLYYGHLRDELFNWPWTEMAWVVAGAVLCWVLARELGWRTVLFAGGWFLLTLFPVLNVVPSGVLVAERNLYLPVAGVVFLAASLACRFEWTRPAYFAVTLLVALCVVNSNLVVRQWRDKEMLWRTTVKMYPTSPMAWAALGHALLEKPGAEDEAESYFERAILLNPNVTGGKHGMGVVAMRRGDYKRALTWLEEAQKSEGGMDVAEEINECKLRIAKQ